MKVFVSFQQIPPATTRGSKVLVKDLMISIYLMYCLMWIIL